MISCAVLISGKGSNLKNIKDCIENKIIPLSLKCVISNNKNAQGLEYLRETDINSYICELTDFSDRDAFDSHLLKYLKQQNVDLIILAGWMHILSPRFVDAFKDQIINLHPALPGMYPGKDAINDAWKAYINNGVNYSGIMCHKVTQYVDKGEVLSQHKVNIYKTDTLESFENRMKYFEKYVLIDGIHNLIKHYHDTNNINKIGKVRTVIDLNYNCLGMICSDKLSSFDRHICSISNKGTILNRTSQWWFENTKHIINNHMLYSNRNFMIVKKCKTFPVEFVVRGYLTGNTATSIWTMYSEGKRNMYGIQWPDGLTKDQPIKPCITPTTKGEKDLPLTPNEVVSKGLMTQDEWDYVSSKAYELFEYGSQVAEESGFILVDTKYEFGRTNEGEIILIDEIHTCDSSRFWVRDEHTTHGLKVKVDKDQIRDYVKENMKNTYDLHEEIPKIPYELKEKVSESYMNFYLKLTNQQELEDYSDTDVNTLNYKSLVSNYFNNIHHNIVIIIAGSEKDKPHVEKIKEQLKSRRIYANVIYSSAHKETQNVVNLIKQYDSQNRNIIWVTVAGRSNALSGVVSANSMYPVIACPPFKDQMDMTVNINSTLQCPSNVPVMTILEPGNVALAIQKIFQLHK